MTKSKRGNKSRCQKTLVVISIHFAFAGSVVNGAPSRALQKISSTLISRLVTSQLSSKNHCKQLKIQGVMNVAADAPDGLAAICRISKEFIEQSGPVQAILRSPFLGEMTIRWICWIVANSTRGRLMKICHPSLLFLITP